MHYPKVTEENKAEMWNMIRESNSVFITSHISPDGDSFSSNLSLYTAIKKTHPEKKVRMVYSNLPVPFYSPFQHFDKIEFVDEAANEIKDADLIIILDAGQWHRVSRSDEAIKTFAAQPRTICIDHHVSKPDPFTLSIIDTNATSCAEVIYHLIDSENIDEEQAKTLLLGILSDTGALKYIKPDQAETFSIAQKLLAKCKMSIDQYEGHYFAMPQRDFQTLQEFIKNMKFEEVSGYTPFAWTHISREYIAAEKLNDVDVTSAKNIFTATTLRSVKGYSWGFSIIPKPDGTVNVSFRSVSGGENVRVIAESMGGGGHDVAAGLNLKNISDPLEAFKIVTEKMRELKAVK